MSSPCFRLAPLVLALAATVVPLASAPALAQGAIAPVPVSINLPAQPLGSALNELARQARVQLMVHPELVAGRGAPAVSGTMTVRDALDRLLAGSGLVARISGEEVVIQRASSAAPAVAPAALPEVRVLAAGDRQTATGPVHGVAATRSAAGTKTDTSLLETPQTVNVVTREELQARGGARTIGQALAYTAGFTQAGGVDLQSDWNLYVRGFTTYQSLFVDGLRLPAGIDRAVPQMEPFGLERVELLKGPASVLYGQSAPGGIINMVSKRPVAESLREVGLELGSHRRRVGTLDLAGAANEEGTLLWRVNALARNSETQIDDIDYDRYFVAPSLTWQPDASTRVTLLSHLQYDDGADFNSNLPAAGTRLPSPYGRIPVGRNLGEPDFDRYQRRQAAIGYELEHRFDEVWSFAQSYRYLDMDVDYRNSGTPAMRDDGRTADRTIYVFDERMRTHTLDTRVQAKFATGAVQHTMVAGIDYRRRKSSNTNGYYWNGGTPIDVFDPVYGTPIPELATPDSLDEEERQFGFYLQDQLRAGPWAVTVGLRRDEAKGRLRSSGGYAEDIEDSATTGRAGVVYLFDNGWAPYVSYATSFEPIVGADFAGVPFKPQKGRQWEAGVKYEPPGRSALVTLAVFDLRQENVLTTDLDNAGFFQKQTGEVRVRGLEIEAKADLRQLAFTASYAWSDAETLRSTDGNEGRAYGGVPRHQAAAWADYRFAGPLQGLRAGAGVRYLGARYGDDFEEWHNPSVTLYDVAFGYQLGALGSAWRDAEVALNIANLGDKVSLTCASTNNCTYGEKRDVQLSFRYRW